MTYTDEELLDALREYAADHDGRPPTIAEANDPSRELPVAQTFINRFGGWNAAVEAAGFAPRNRRRSEEDLLDALSAFAADHDGRVTYAFEAELPLERTFDFHDADRETITAVVVRVDWRGGDSATS